MLIVEEEVLRKSISSLKFGSPLGLDIETTGLDPHTSEIRTIQLSDGRVTLVIDVGKLGCEAAARALRPVFEDPRTIKVLHNAKFDLKFIKHHLKTDVEGIFDTMISSILLEAGIPRPKGWHSLAQVAARYLGTEISKTEQRSNWSGELTAEQIAYAARDAEVMLPLREAQVAKLRQMGLVRAAKLEFDAVLPVAWLELSGFYLDLDQWLAVAAENRLKAAREAAVISDFLRPHVRQQTLFGEIGVDLNSIKQIREYYTAAGVPMPDSTKEWVLEPLAAEYPAVRALLNYRGFDKAANSFGENWRAFINPATGRIHADFRQLGAETGRMSCSNPNLQQCPSDAAHRNCFKAEEGRTLVSLDYSQIELRILADLASDQNAIEAFRSGVDYHRAMAAGVFRVPLEKVDHEQRSFAKRLNFGIPYGIGPTRFAMQCGILVTEAQLIMNDYFRAVPRIKRWLDYQKLQILRHRSTRSASGRLVTYEFDDADGASRSMAQRNACNFPIQATSADILKRALRLVYDRLRDYQRSVLLVNVVHDEINLEVRDTLVEEVGAIVHQAMIEAAEEFIREAPVKVDMKVSKYWSKE